MSVLASVNSDYYELLQNRSWVFLLNLGFTILAMYHLAYLGVMFGSQSPEEQDLELQVSISHVSWCPGGEGLALAVSVCGCPSYRNSGKYFVMRFTNVSILSLDEGKNKVLVQL